MDDKPQDLTGYPSDRTERVERVLLEIWSRLGEFREHMVLVGGLAPRYLVAQDGGAMPKHCGTFDVDLAVSLAVADLATYASIRAVLDRMGLQPGVNKRGRAQRHSFVMPDPSGPVVVDFLTTKYDGPPEVVRAVESQLSAIQVEGLGLAFLDPLEVSVGGQTLSGGMVTEIVRVCRPLPFIVLKALAFQNRREGKDAFDLVYLLQGASEGAAGLAKAVRPEEIGAASFRKARESLARNFESPEHDGPIRYMRFVGGEPGADARAYAAVREFLEGLPE